MSIWKDNAPSKSTPVPVRDVTANTRSEATSNNEFAAASHIVALSRSEPDRVRKESLIASDLIVEGKIEGAGSVRIAGKFKGDVNVQGDLTIEVGAKLTGGVRAHQVIIAGELEGNIESAARVDLQPSAVVSGDIKAGALTVASGARMRGHAVFGWDDDRAGKLGIVAESGTNT